MNKPSETYATQMMSIIDRLIFMEKNTVISHGKDLKLYPSEIHLILLIDKGATSNATEMAEHLGVTKGAISQTITRLVKKGILKKRRDPHHKNALTLSFTPLGEDVLAQCQQLRIALRDQFSSYFDSLSQADQAVIGRFLSFMEALVDAVE